jgi:hypothetical protein
MSACPTPDERPAPASNLFEELARLKQESEQAKKNYDAILERLKKLEETLRERESKRKEK